MYCSRRLYKGNSYEFCLPLADTGVTEVYFYTDGEFKVGKEPVICGDTMCFTLAAEDIEAMKDGVLRYTDNGDLDTNTPYVVVTPEGYEAKTLDEIVEEAYQSGFTDGYASCDTDYSKMYLTIEAIEKGIFYVGMADIDYSVNEGPWETTTGLTELSISYGDTVRFRGTSGGREIFANNNEMTFNVYGNIESLEYGDNFIGQTITHTDFRGAFQNSVGLFDASNLILPATTLYSTCYANMFWNCQRLVAAPELPATTTVYQCYFNMFRNCKSLVIAPELPATTLAARCYGQMFYDCSSLKYVKCLATTLAINNTSTSVWLQGVSPTGTFVTPSTTNWETGESGIPYSWTRVDVN